MVNWYTDFQSEMAVYLHVPWLNWLFPYLNMRIKSFVNSSENREKFLTYADFWDIGYAEVITYVDADGTHAYENIPKIEQCLVYDLPKHFSLKQLFQDVKNPHSGLTTYLGEQGLPFVWYKTFYAFKVDVNGYHHTIYFDKHTRQPSWIVLNGSNIVMSVEKIWDRPYSDVDFDQAWCNPRKNIENPF